MPSQEAITDDLRALAAAIKADLDAHIQQVYTYKEITTRITNEVFNTITIKIHCPHATPIYQYDFICIAANHTISSVGGCFKLENPESVAKVLIKIKNCMARGHGR